MAEETDELALEWKSTPVIMAENRFGWCKRSRIVALLAFLRCRHSNADPNSAVVYYKLLLDIVQGERC